MGPRQTFTVSSVFAEESDESESSESKRTCWNVTPPPRPGSGKGPFFAGWEQPFSDPGRTAPEIFRAIHTAIATDMTPFKAAFSSLTFMLLTSRQPTNKEPSPDSSRGPTCVVRTLFPRPPSNCPRDMSDHRLGKRCTEGHRYTAL